VVAAAAALAIVASAGRATEAERLAPAPVLRFQFGANAPPPGWVRVDPDTPFTEARGWGFEPQAGRSAANQPGGPPPARFFSTALPEGNYDVTVALGDETAATTNTVKAETRRLMLERVVTAPGEVTRRTFSVNIRTPEIPGGGAVRLKAREKGVWHWDRKLTLEFNGARPGVRAVEITPCPAATTIYLLGDSTVTDQPEEPWSSWGQMLPRFFKPGVAVANHAESGESLKSSLGARRVAKVLASLRPGDYVLVQFGHNDQKDRAPDALETYRANLRALVAHVRQAGATPVIVTSMERKAGVERETLAGYPAAARDVAAELKAPLIDLQAMSRVLYRALGDRIGLAFQDGTHHNAFGSYELARCVVEGIRANHLGLAGAMADDAGVFDPSHPDSPGEFRVPASPGSPGSKPDGN